MASCRQKTGWSLSRMPCGGGNSDGSRQRACSSPIYPPWLSPVRILVVLGDFSQFLWPQFSWSVRDFVVNLYFYFPNFLMLLSYFWSILASFNAGAPSPRAHSGSATESKGEKVHTEIQTKTENTLKNQWFLQLNMRAYVRKVRHGLHCAPRTLAGLSIPASPPMHGHWHIRTRRRGSSLLEICVIF